MLKKAIGCDCYYRIVPMAVANVTVSNIKGRLKLGGINIGASVMALFKVSKASWASSDQLSWSFLKSKVNGLAMEV